MRASRKATALTVCFLVLVPTAATVAQQMAIRHTAVACFGSGSTVNWIDLFDPSVPGSLHDWGVVNKLTTIVAAPAISENIVYCPLAAIVPTNPALGWPVDGARVIYSTAAPINTTSGLVTPEISSCSIFIMDDTAGGTWVRQSSAPGANTNGLLNNGTITMGGGATVNLATANLNRILITCQLPRMVFPAGGGGAVTTAMIKGYELTYSP